MNNIDANFDKISDLVKKYFDDQIKTYNEKNKSNDYSELCINDWSNSIISESRMLDLY